MSNQLSASDFAGLYETPVELVTLAQDNLKAHKAIALAVSGKFGAGKDTVAPITLDDLSFDERIHEFFAKPLKDEVDVLIGIIAANETKEETIAIAVEALEAPADQISIMVERLWAEVKSGEVTTSRTRTANTRFALQFWGTEVRRAQDENYWVKKAITSTVEKLANGDSVFVTDARFTNEIDALEALGAHTVRLIVSEAEQTRRILARDGIVPTDEARNHISETALDEYEAQGKFDVLVDTDNLSTEEVTAVVVNTLREIRGTNGQSA